VDSANVYWMARYGDTSTESIGEIRRCLKNYSCGDKGADVVVPNQFSLTSILVHKGFLYWTRGPTENRGDYVACSADGNIQRCQLPVCTPVRFATTMHCPSSLTADGDLLYWATSLGIFGGAGEILYAPVNDGLALTLFQTTPDAVNALAVGPTAVYWVTRQAVLSKRVK